MAKRRQLREQEVVEVLINQGAVIPCHRCGVPFTMEDVRTGNIENEHLHERELGGSDDPFNRRFSHKAKPCHSLITHGNGATFAGSSRHKIAKANDPERKDKFKVRKRALRELTPDRVSTPSGRCSRCGEHRPCPCPPPAKRSSFQRRA